MNTTTDVTHREKDERASHPCALDTIPERVRQIAMLRGLGYSYRQIAGPLQVTPQAVSLMLMRHRRSLKSLRAAMELNSLSARAVNALGRHGIRTREQARQANAARPSRRPATARRARAADHPPRRAGA